MHRELTWYFVLQKPSLIPVQGHRTYPAFVHFLACITLLALYIAVISGSALLYAFNNPLDVVSSSYPLPVAEAES